MVSGYVQASEEESLIDAPLQIFRRVARMQFECHSATVQLDGLDFPVPSCIFLRR